MFRNFGLCKRPLLAVLGVLVASTLATANAATIDMSQLTSNGAKPVVISLQKRQVLIHLTLIMMAI